MVKKFDREVSSQIRDEGNESWRSPTEIFDNCQGRDDQIKWLGVGCEEMGESVGKIIYSVL